MEEKTLQQNPNKVIDGAKVEVPKIEAHIEVGEGGNFRTEVKHDKGSVVLHASTDVPQPGMLPGANLLFIGAKDEMGNEVKKLLAMDQETGDLYEVAQDADRLKLGEEEKKAFYAAIEATVRHQMSSMSNRPKILMPAGPAKGPGSPGGMGMGGMGMGGMGIIPVI